MDCIKLLEQHFVCLHAHCQPGTSTTTPKVTVRSFAIGTCFLSKFPPAAGTDKDHIQMCSSHVVHNKSWEVLLYMFSSQCPPWPRRHWNQNGMLGHNASTTTLLWAICICAFGHMKVAPKSSWYETQKAVLASSMFFRLSWHPSLQTCNHSLKQAAVGFGSFVHSCQSCWITWKLKFGMEAGVWCSGFEFIVHLR